MKRSEALRIEAAAMRDAAEQASEVFGLGTTDPEKLRSNITNDINYIKGCVAGTMLVAKGVERSAEKAETEGD